MTSDFALMSIYAMCALMVRTRLSLLALVCFIASVVVVTHIHKPWLLHTAFVCIYAVLLPHCDSDKTRFATFSIVLFQYLMAWDANLFSSDETILFYAYPMVSFTLNLLLIFTIAKSGSETIGSNNHTFTDWLSHLQLVATHQKRMRKG